jgi:hypothetical protein
MEVLVVRLPDCELCWQSATHNTYLSKLGRYVFAGKGQENTTHDLCTVHTYRYGYPQSDLTGRYVIASTTDYVAGKAPWIRPVNVSDAIVRAEGVSDK